ncbi:hypothetical protein D9M71_39050 [compost metagenome]
MTGIIDNPEHTREYRDGAEARRQNAGREDCPYGPRRLLKRSLWLAGWHDTDMEAV